MKIATRTLLKTSHVTATAIAAGLLTFAFPAAAQNGAESKPIESPELFNYDDDFLAGPDVAEDAKQDRKGRRAGNGKDGAKHPARKRAENRMWMRALRGVELSDDQRAQIRAEVEAFTKKRSIFTDMHGEELRSIRLEMKQARETQERPSPELRKRAEEIQKKAPKPVELQKKIWTMLDESQQEQLKGELAAMKKKLASMRKDGERGRRGAEGERQQRRRDRGEKQGKKGSSEPLFDDDPMSSDK